MIIDILKAIFSFIKGLFISNNTKSVDEYKLEAKESIIKENIQKIEKKEKVLKSDGVKKLTPEETLAYWENEDD